MACRAVAFPPIMFMPKTSLPRLCPLLPVLTFAQRLVQEWCTVHARVLLNLVCVCGGRHLLPRVPPSKRSRRLLFSSHGKVGPPLLLIIGRPLERAAPNSCQ